MLTNIYLTPASISYLNQVILALVITAYLGWHFFLQKGQRTSASDRWLFFFFCTLTVFSLALFLETSCMPTERLVVVYLLNTLLALLLVALIQFAYFFPQPSAKQRIERWLALLASLAYVALELREAIFRFSLLHEAHVVFRPPNWDYVPVALFAWVIFVFGRGTVRSWHNPASRRFALIILIPLALAGLNILLSHGQISSTFYNISTSIGILFTVFLFALNYLVSQPEATSLMVKFSGGILTGVLAVFGVVAWLVAPFYVEQYRPAVIDHRSIRFTPNSQGGYDVAEIPFHFESEMGKNLELTNEDNRPPGYQGVAFDFPFYEKQYSEVFITNNGLLTFGQPVEYWSLEYRLSKAPIFFALGFDLNPELNPKGGIYLRQEANQLVITYDHIRATYYPQREYTFQVVLYGDGRIDLTYNGLPSGPQYQVDDRMDASIWVIGAKPGLATNQTVSFASLPLSSGPQGVLDDQDRAFRQYVHTFLWPLAIAILVSSLFFLVGLPVTLYAGMARPLRRLLAGMERFNQDKYHQPIPIQFNDEIGYLTQTFNSLTDELNNLIQTLETRVADRTADLLDANTQLSKLSIAVEQSPSVIIITDPKGAIEYVNPAFIRSSGYSFDEVKGRNPSLLKSGETPPETFKEMWETLLSGKTWRGELSNRKKNGEIYWESTVIAHIQDAEGQTTYYVAIQEDITARKAVERELELLATTDSLTGLPNRRFFFTEAEKIFARSQHPPYELAILMLDIDHFKEINDRYGHLAGDMVLHEIAMRVHENLRPTDMVARYGGDEFVALLPRTPFSTLVSITSRLNEVVRDTPILSSGESISVTISVGAAMLTGDSQSLHELLTQADQSMYRAKQQGHDRTVIWEEERG